MQIKIANFSEAVVNDRFDAQFFRPEYDDSCNIVSKGVHHNLSNIAYISDGNHLKIAEEFDTADGIRYLRGQDLGTDMMLSDKNVVYIPEVLFKELKRSHIFKLDILVTIVGANTGLVGLVYDPPAKLVANCKLGIIRADTNKILPGYLYAFLISKFGQHQILRSVRGGGQTGLILPDMRNLHITRFKSDFEKTITEIVLYGHQKVIESKREFINSQTLLLSELGLLNWQPKHRLTFVKNYSDTQAAERVDAEYFQPKYEEIIAAIKTYSGGWDTLEGLVSVKKCVEVGSEEYLDEGIPFVRVSNLSPFEISEEKYISEELYSKLSQHQPKQDEILFSKDATPGIAHYLREEPQKMIPSGGILRLKRKDGRVNDEYLTLVLNSVLTKEQVNRDAGGSVILHWRPDQVKATVIPILPKKIQTQIQQKITKSFNLRKQSKHLLECAKHAVEIAIEQDEATATEWLKQQEQNTKRCRPSNL